MQDASKRQRSREDELKPAKRSAVSLTAHLGSGRPVQSRDLQNCGPPLFQATNVVLICDSRSNTINSGQRRQAVNVAPRGRDLTQNEWPCLQIRSAEIHFVYN